MNLVVCLNGLGREDDAALCVSSRIADWMSLADVEPFSLLETEAGKSAHNANR